MNKMMKSTLLTLALVCGAAFAQETVTSPEFSTEGSANDWNLKLGVSYRKFKNPKFTADKYAAQSGAYLDGESTVRPLNEVLAELKDTIIANVNVVTSTGGTASGKGDYGFWESCGPMIGASYTLSEDNSLRLSLVADFQYFKNDSGKYAAYSGSSSATQYVAVYGSLAPEGENIGSGADFSGGVAKMTMDMDLYVFDLGLSLGYEFENNFSIAVAAGPTISLADIDSSCRILGYNKRTDNDTEFEYGFFVSANAAYWFNERYGLSAEIRYDNSFGTVGTRYVKQNLDALGGNLAFLVRF